MMSSGLASGETDFRGEDFAALAVFAAADMMSGRDPVDVGVREDERSDEESGEVGLRGSQSPGEVIVESYGGQGGKEKRDKFLRSGLCSRTRRLQVRCSLVRGWERSG